MTGNDAGEEAAFGHGPEATENERTSSSEPPGATDGEDPTDPERALPAVYDRPHRPRH